MSFRFRGIHRAGCERLWKNGFTLVETLIALMVVAIALPPLLYLFTQTLWSGAETVNRLKAEHLGRSLMEEICSKKWDENAGGGSPVADADKTWPLGPEAGESRTGSGVNSFDDVDDYHGFSEDPPADPQGGGIGYIVGFRSSVEVFYVGTADLDAEDTGPPLPDYKHVCTTITWDGGSFQVSTLRGNS